MISTDHRIHRRGWFLWVLEGRAAQFRLVAFHGGTKEQPVATVSPPVFMPAREICEVTKAEIERKKQGALAVREAKRRLAVQAEK